ncbi:hypothetical protein [Candidatus Sulfurimonas baltica]|uniref:Uncharacterized protein n=1 Tax=Candidatus Sulfurimonas baltica TaxID=2740404 RepID=A0A7S7LXL0_9BACT|nr:hypothetical protein [Candidatus Sulfurimonas baltica]QOY53240.1 hypothetical protein HUE88_06050 [Candidatus Sulfurimonas baltica]
MKKTFLKINGLLTTQEFKFLQEHISDLPDWFIFDGEQEINADAGLVHLLAGSGFRVAMNSSDTAFKIHIQDRLDKDDREYLTDTDKYNIHLKDFFDNYKNIHNAKQIVEYYNVAFAINTIFGINQFKYLLHNIDILETTDYVFNILFNFINIVLEKKEDFIDDFEEKFIVRLNTEKAYRTDGTITDELLASTGLTAQEIQEAKNKRDKNFEKHQNPVQEVLKAQEEPKRAVQPEISVDFLNTEDKKDWIARKFTLESYNGKYTDMTTLVSDMEKVDNEGISFFVVDNAKIVYETDKDNVEFFADSEFPKFIHFQNCEFFFITPTKVENLFLKFNKYFFTQNSSINLITMETPPKVEDIDTSAYPKSLSVTISFQDSLFNSIEDITDYKIIVNMSADKEIYVEEGSDRITITTFKYVSDKCFDNVADKIDYMLDGMITHKVII